MKNLVPVRIKIGELFKKLNIDNNQYEILQVPNIDIFISTPENELTRIQGFVKKQNNNILNVVLENGISFKCSENHLIQNEEGLTTKVKDANFLWTVDGLQKIVSKDFDKVADVYDISISAPHLYVTPNGIIHHNTFILMEMIKSAQKQGYTAVLYDSELANTNKDDLAARGIDVENLLYIPIDTVENLKTSILNILEEVTEKDKLFIGIDSLGNLSTNKEMQDSIDGSEKKDMTRAAQLKALFRTITMKAGIKQVPIVGISHTYAAVGSFIPQQIVGGGCLTKENKVKCEDGEKFINDIKIGDKVSTLFGLKEVYNTFKFNNKEILQLELENGNILKCTPEHKFLIQTKLGLEWKTADSLNENDFIISY